MRKFETSPDEPVVSLLSPEFEDDPVGALARLRDRSPLVRVGFPGGERVWLVTRAEDIRKVMSDPRFVVDVSKVPGHEGPSLTEQMVATLDLSDELSDYFGANLMLEDGQSHVRLRRVLAPAFTNRRIEALRPRIEEISAQLLDTLERKGAGDLLHEYAAPLTITVICELIGIDEADQPQIRKWMAEYVNVEADFTSSLLGLCGHLKELLKRRRAQPANDLISTLVQAMDAEDVQLSEADAISLTVTLVNASYHAMNDFIVNAVLVLEENPDQLALLRADPTALPHAVEELMRIGSSISNAGPRYATHDMEFAGVPIRQGDALTGSIHSANFDPRYFPRPEQCDIQRRPKPGEGHLSFGAGPHRCIGAALANLEGGVAIDHLMLQRDSVKVAVSRSELTYRDTMPGGAPRLLTSLPVRM
ncbi:cytochrome P450 [Streptomyces mirabilis]|uniref:cytochrome P450 n=1 Tax=Streptomyces mirabilis TaxID=68239 RepID=UPI0036BCD973